MYDRIKDLLIGEAEEPKKKPAQKPAPDLTPTPTTRSRRRSMDATLAAMAKMKASKSGRSRPDTSLGN